MRWGIRALAVTIVTGAMTLAALPAPAGASVLDDVVGAVVPTTDPYLAGWTAPGDPGYVAPTNPSDLTLSPASNDDEPLYVGWTSALPALASGYEPSSQHVCKRGATKCVDLTIENMTRRFDRLAPTCSHNAVFSLLYLRTTEEYRRTIEDPTFFDDTPFVNHEDAVFAKYYFDAFDNWYGKYRWWKVDGQWESKAPNAADVPPAWQVAFQAADSRSVQGLGDVLLGMNAHINRDLAFVLADIGLVKPDGTSRKPDHDKVNEFLNRVTLPALSEVAQRFDPTIDDADVQYTTLDETADLQIVMSWREEAWRNAERLVSASTPEERAQVAQSIEDGAYLEAQLIKSAYSYDGIINKTSTRDAYCAQHWDDQV